MKNLCGSQKSMRSTVLLGLVTLVVTACTNMCQGKRASLAPDAVVEAYLDTALNMTDVRDRDKLLDYTTGALKEAIEGASHDTIRNAYVDRKYTLQNFSVVQRRDRTPRETEITFQIKYLDHAGSPDKDKKDVPMVVTENTVSVIKEKGLWKIRDVLGAKTAIDFPVSPDSEIKAKPGVVSPEEPSDPDPAPEQGK